MLKASVKKHPYYMGNVSIEIEPNEIYNYTDCLVRVRYEGTEYENEETPFEWAVTIPHLVANPLEAIEELTKERYWGEGVSESID